ncbi:3'(2'),5'-bisphosphate nucleotidase [Verruconis gallopava]|uniref:3'(2'),5'-bisphosphate nucleotidase n=1 Tax=Verruconis gallopava TaxID=253628 RepID=A0A0D2ABL2_9PEZI|nr:3'(2'),5'-bisphosphate nucleotidase [Verruconis gallopava]KIW04208.1 3'(2'),5'-bisphosphate nucleotidase [Verruconis gallopava]
MKNLSEPRAIILLSVFILAASLIPTISSRLTQLARHITNRASSSTFSAMSSNYAHELDIALLAVQRAAILTKNVFHTTAKGTVSKSDASPVTVGDFGAQALIIAALKHNFPSDEIVAEEEASDLRENSALRDQIWEYVKATKLDDAEAEKSLGGSIENVDKMLDIIDQGNSPGGRKGRIWAIDPIDGTKGFLRGGQYAVCLALMVDGKVKVGVLGCPNLPVDDNARIDASIGKDQTDDEGKGVLISAVQGQGATSRPLTKAGLAEAHPIMMKPLTDLSQAAFCESVEAGHSNQTEQAEIARRCGIAQESVRMDSQAKYASIARGAGDIYLRLPAKKGYQEKIWDHAAGTLIVAEAGGKVTDSEGNAHDFGLGRTLGENKGFVAANKNVHDKLLKVVQEVLGVSKS